MFNWKFLNHKKKGWASYYNEYNLKMGNMQIIIEEDDFNEGWKWEIRTFRTLDVKYGGGDHFSLYGAITGPYKSPEDAQKAAIYYLTSFLRPIVKILFKDGLKTKYPKPPNINGWSEIRA